MHFRKVRAEVHLLFAYCCKKSSHYFNSIHRKNYITVSASILAEKMQMFVIIRLSPELAKMNAPNVITLEKSTRKREHCYHNKTDA